MSSDHRQKSLAALNKLWQGDPITRTRAGDGQVTLYGRRMSMHLMVQPGVARAFMADPMAADTGFLPRFLMCEPPSTIGTRLHNATEQNRAPLNAFSARLRAILETAMPMDPETRALKPRTIALSHNVRALLIEFHDSIERAKAKGGDLAHLTGYASKAAEQAARIAGVLTLWRDLDAAHVTSEDMAHGIILAQFYLSEASRLADAATISAEIDRAERLRVWLLESWPHDDIPPSEVVQKAPIRALRETPAAKAALALLATHG